MLWFEYVSDHFAVVLWRAILITPTSSQLFIHCNNDEGSKSPSRRLVIFLTVSTIRIVRSDTLVSCITS